MGGERDEEIVRAARILRLRTRKAQDLPPKVSSLVVLRQVAQLLENIVPISASAERSTA
jgi:hypothetical protein